MRRRKIAAFDLVCAYSTHSLSSTFLRIPLLSIRTPPSSKPFLAIYTPKIPLIGDGGILVFPQH